MQPTSSACMLRVIRCRFTAICKLWNRARRMRPYRPMLAAVVLCLCRQRHLTVNRDVIFVNVRETSHPSVVCQEFSY